MPGSSNSDSQFHGRASLDFDDIGFIVVSSILAPIALLSHSVPVLIGAMILAPVFDPLIAVPFGLVNRDPKLAMRGLANSVLLLVISGLVCFGTVWVALYFDAVPASLTRVGPDMVTERLTIGWHSFVIAIAAGAGGALAFASNRRENIVGVAVALALIHALAAAAIGFRYGLPTSWSGIWVVVLNVGGIIVAGLAVLSLRRVAGRSHREE